MNPSAAKKKGGRTRVIRACRRCEFRALPEELQRELNDTCRSSASNGPKLPELAVVFGLLKFT